MTELFPLELRDISKRYGAVRALSDVSLTIAAGECIALLGENGAGKSTLMKILAGSAQPSAGEIRAAGEPVQLLSPRDAGRRGIHLCPQELQIVPAMTVQENLDLGDEPSVAGFLRRSGTASDDPVREALLDLGFTRSMSTPMASLSIADRQLVAICKGLRPHIRLVILDEPTASLAPSEVERVIELVRRLIAANKSVAYISHRLDEIESVADRAIVLRDGQIVGEISPQASQDEVVKMMVGREIVNLYPHTRRLPGEVRVAVNGVSAPGVRDVSFEVRAGEVVGLGGLVGSGQAELAKAIYGLSKITAGAVSVSGRPLKTGRVRTAIAAGISFLGEDRRREGMVFSHSIFDNVALPLLKSASPAGIIRFRAVRERVTELARQARIKASSLAAPMSSLSGGNQQKAVLARALITRPEFLILLEPTRGVDVGARADIYELLDQLTEQGTGILIVSSDLPELVGLSDRILVMYKGAVVGEVDRDDATPALIGELATGHSEGQS